MAENTGHIVQDFLQLLFGFASLFVNASSFIIARANRGIYFSSLSSFLNVTPSTRNHINARQSLKSTAISFLFIGLAVCQRAAIKQIIALMKAVRWFLFFI